jgi:hypothetical protein
VYRQLLPPSFLFSLEIIQDEEIVNGGTEQHNKKSTNHQSLTERKQDERHEAGHTNIIYRETSKTLGLIFSALCQTSNVFWRVEKSSDEVFSATRILTQQQRGMEFSCLNARERNKCQIHEEGIPFVSSIEKVKKVKSKKKEKKRKQTGGRIREMNKMI